MVQDIKNQYYVLRKGALQEEACEWQDLEAMCKTGRLSADAKIFFPQEDCWKKVIDTDLAQLLEAAQAQEEDPEDVLEGEDDRHQEYQQLLDQLQDDPGDLGLLLDAAALALGMQDIEAAKYATG